MPAAPAPRARTGLRLPKGLKKVKTPQPARQAAHPAKAKIIRSLEAPREQASLAA